jgi:predicted dithiol-disulfide oxidoreductase (DUF899 family)
MPNGTLWIDGWNGVAHHLAQNVDVAIVAAADPIALRAHARTRGWHRLRLLSCGDNTFKYDLGREDREGNQDSTVSVFTRNNDGTVRHFYTAHPSCRATSKSAASTSVSRWHVLDLTPQGRVIGTDLGYGT